MSQGMVLGALQIFPSKRTNSPVPYITAALLTYCSTEALTTGTHWNYSILREIQTLIRAKKSSI